MKLFSLFNLSLVWLVQNPRDAFDCHQIHPMESRSTQWSVSLVLTYPMEYGSTKWSLSLV